jgi:hypothetical protein
MKEVTHTLQHLMAQAAHDTKWIDSTQAAIEDHAKLIDDNAAKSKMLNQIGHQLRSDINKALATVETNDIAMKEWSTLKFAKIEAVIEELAAVSQQSVASLDTSLREQVKAEIVDLRSAVDKIHVDGGGAPTDIQLVFKLTQLEAHFRELARTVKGGSGEGCRQHRHCTCSRSACAVDRRQS